MPETTKPWKLSYGCHQGNVTTRDPGNPEYHDSLQQCRDAFSSIKKHWDRMGLKVWYANATGPDNKEIPIHRGEDYA